MLGKELAGHTGLWRHSVILRFLTAATLFVCLLGQATPLRAEGVTINGEHPAQKIDMNIDNAPLGEVLKALHEKYGIEVAGVDDANADDPISMTISGNLPSILERLLRNRNYMLVRSHKNITGVEKILITAVTHDDAAPKNKPNGASANRPDP
jgi:hypothetical protein